jgi:hypothetical protein
LKAKAAAGDLTGVHLSRGTRRSIQAFAGADRDEEIKDIVPATSRHVAGTSTP